MRDGNGDWIRRYDSIQQLEKALKERVSAVEGSPFIAHSDAPPKLEEAALKQLIDFVEGSLQRFFWLMARFPCVCTRVIATALANSYGEKGAQVYGPIAARLGVGSIPVQSRHRLYFAFRDACEMVGLALPPQGRMVDAYLFQAGVSRNQLPALALAFLKAERLLGLPRSDDTREVDDWEDRAVGLAPEGNKVLRRIVREDPTGYHATTFIRLSRSSSSPTREFEAAFYDAIRFAKESPKGTGSHPHLRPTVEFVQGDLWLAIPRGASRLEIRIHGRIHPLSRGRRLALPLPWPSYIEWRRPSAVAWRQLQLFADPRRVLVFDADTGLQRGELDPALPNGQRVRAGQLCVLSQTAFRINEQTCHQVGPEAFVLFCDISREMILHQGDFRCEVVVEARLRLDVVGKRIARNRDGWLLAGPIAARVQGRSGGSSEALVVRVRHPALDGELQCRVHNACDGPLSADLDMPTTGDFGLAQASLHIRGQERALYQTKFWYWPGLERLAEGRVFVTTSIPHNLAEEQMAHIERDRRGRLVVLEGEAYLRARLCFWVGRKLVSFSLPPPGASVSVRRADGTERPLRVGESIAVRDDYASSLIVRYSDPTAAIDLKGEVIPAAFGKTGSWCVSFAALKQEGEHNRVRLLFDTGLRLGQDLVRVVPEAQPTFFTARQVDTLWFCDAGFEGPIDAMRIKAENLINGERLEADLSVASPPDHSVLATMGQITSSNNLQIAIHQDNLGDGVWFIDFQVREEGREDWLPLINSFGESYAICIASRAYTQKLTSGDTSEWCPEADRAQAFLRLSRAIETPIARTCRPTVVDLGLDAWQRLGRSLDPQDPGCRRTLLDACALPPSPFARESWIPVHHPIEIKPNLFGVSAVDIGELGSSDASGYEEFESVGLAGLTESLEDAVAVLDVSATFLIAFAGARKPNESPGAFDFERYCLFAPRMKNIDDKPLSLWHHDRACERMADRVAITRGARLSKAMMLVQQFRLQEANSAKTLDLPHDLADGFALVMETPRVIAALTKAWRFGDAEAFWHSLASTLSWPTERVRKHMGTLLRLAPELLAFYLLLWVLVERHETA